MDSLTLFLPDLPLPERAYLPGQNTRSAIDPPPLTTSDGDHRLAEDPCFLRGVDLFNHGFYYEAHEAWEQIWINLQKETPQRRLFNGLIQVSASLLKLRLGQPVPALGLWKRACRHLEAATDRLGHSPFGFDLVEWLTQIETIVISEIDPGDRPPPILPETVQ